MNWADLVPESIAIRQRAYERRRSIRRARYFGVTFKVMANKLKISQSRIAQLFNRRESWRSPVEEYLSSLDEEFKRRRVAFWRNLKKMEEA